MKNNKQKILVIEDDQSIRETLYDILKLKGYEVITAKNGKEGVSKAIFDIPDLILCDIMMPELDGFQTIEMIEKIPAISDIPFIFLSAKAQPEDFRNGLKLGADDYITKPFEVDDLLASIHKRIEKFQKLKSYNSELISSLLENSLSGIFIYSDNKFIVVNENLTTMTGYSLSMLNKINLNEIFKEGLEKLCSCYKGIDKSIKTSIEIYDNNKEQLIIDLSAENIKIDNKYTIVGNILVKNDTNKLPKEQLTSENTEFAQILDFLSDTVEDNVKNKIIEIETIINRKKQAKREKLKKEINLSKREMEVLKLICQGNTNVEIGEKLFISNRTVDNHRSNLLLKTGRKNTAELVSFTLINNIIDL